MGSINMMLRKALQQQWVYHLPPSRMIAVARRWGNPISRTQCINVHYKSWTLSICLITIHTWYDVTNMTFALLTSWALGMVILRTLWARCLWWLAHAQRPVNRKIYGQLIDCPFLLLGGQEASWLILHVLHCFASFFYYADLGIGMDLGN